MAIPVALAQIDLNLAPGLLPGFHLPPQPANPPTSVNVTSAVRLKAEVDNVLRKGEPLPDAAVEAVAFFESEVIAARQIGLLLAAAAPAAPAAPGAPLAAGGVALILTTIRALGNRLDARMDGIDQRLDGLQREIAFNGNIGKGTGVHIPFTEVLFRDGSLPSVAVVAAPGQLGRPALPALLDVDVIRNLTFQDAGHYLTHHGVAPLPASTVARRTRVAQIIGCVVDFRYVHHSRLLELTSSGLLMYRAGV
ncbi:hypothetical protein B0H15DRAFT_427962 [Mycena belliarum]|uniref:Mug135-like C-terminal domain-containing protein n=1 Tax=Mycena belliarum TaxID=1033014 RepID=A0AAD6U332_9AGAR|nr:hypothetical protein B0H15DRAFT_427962 [Mycena belliae]